MRTIIVAEKEITLSEEGFLLDRALWSESVAKALAAAENITLTEAHWQCLHALRDFYDEYEMIPPLRVFIKYIREHISAELGTSLALHKLFPGTPLKLISKCAGLPKPKHCM